MSATDELRALLDERGVEHFDGPGSTLWLKEELGYRASADEMTSGRLSVHVWCDTPAQAVEATLGRGKCRLPKTRIDHGRIEYNGTTEWRMCSACGEEVLAFPAHFCPSCGREVVER